MKLIKECVTEVKFLTEADQTTGKRKYFIEGIFMQAERPNKNRRQYKFETLLKESQRYNEQYIKTNRAYGELGHPNTPSINLDRVSHMIKVLRQEGNDFYGKALILETPMGMIARNLLDAGASLGVSTRGLGSVTPGPNGIDLVEDDFKLATAADIVADPSAPDAFVQGIMEGKEWLFVEGHYVEKDIEKAKKTIELASSSQINDVAIKLFEEFMRKL
jgi:hypothetical protein